MTGNNFSLDPRTDGAISAFTNAHQDFNRKENIKNLFAALGEETTAANFHNRLADYAEKTLGANPDYKNINEAALIIFGHDAAKEYFASGYRTLPANLADKTKYDDFKKVYDAASAADSDMARKAASTGFQGPAITGVSNEFEVAIGKAAEAANSTAWTQLGRKLGIKGRDNSVSRDEAMAELLEYAGKIGADKAKPNQTAAALLIYGEVKAKEFFAAAYDIARLPPGVAAIMEEARKYDAEIGKRTESSAEVQFKVGKSDKGNIINPDDLTKYFYDLSRLADTAIAANHNNSEKITLTLNADIWTSRSWTDEGNQKISDARSATLQKYMDDFKERYKDRLNINIQSRSHGERDLTFRTVDGEEAAVNRGGVVTARFSDVVVATPPALAAQPKPADKPVEIALVNEEARILGKKAANKFAEVIHSLENSQSPADYNVERQYTFINSNPRAVESRNSQAIMAAGNVFDNLANYASQVYSAYKSEPKSEATRQKIQQIREVGENMHSLMEYISYDEKHVNNKKVRAHAAEYISKAQGLITEYIDKSTLTDDKKTAARNEVVAVFNNLNAGLEKRNIDREIVILDDNIDPQSAAGRGTYASRRQNNVEDKMFEAILDGNENKIQRLKRRSEGAEDRKNKFAHIIGGEVLEEFDALQEARNKNKTRRAEALEKDLALHINQLRSMGAEVRYNPDDGKAPEITFLDGKIIREKTIKEAGKVAAGLNGAAHDKNATATTPQILPLMDWTIPPGSPHIKD